MRRPNNDLPEVYLCVKPVDFRKGIDGLAALVEGAFGLSPFSEKLFVFTNRGRDKVRVLDWERNGFYLWMKRLEQERFKWPSFLGEEVATFTAGPHAAAMRTMHSLCVAVVRLRNPHEDTTPPNESAASLDAPHRSLHRAPARP